MISASWPMPKSYTTSERKDTQENSVIEKSIKSISVLNQKKGEIDNLSISLSESEKELLKTYLDEAIKKLASKAFSVQLKADVTTHDLDDVYDPQGKVPFPKKHVSKKQPSLFDGIDFGWDKDSEDEIF
jgi:hypothetical protein